MSGQLSVFSRSAQQAMHRGSRVSDACLFRADSYSLASRGLLTSQRPSLPLLSHPATRAFASRAAGASFSASTAPTDSSAVDASVIVKGAAAGSKELSAKQALSLTRSQKDAVASYAPRLDAVAKQLTKDLRTMDSASQVLTYYAANKGEFDLVSTSTALRHVLSLNSEVKPWKREALPKTAFRELVADATEKLTDAVGQLIASSSSSSSSLSREKGEEASAAAAALQTLAAISKGELDAVSSKTGEASRETALQLQHLQKQQQLLRSISSTSWSLAKVGQLPTPLLDELSSVLPEQVPLLSSQDMVQLAYAYKRKNVPAPRLFSAISSHLQQGRNLWQLEDKELLGLLESFSVLKHASPTLFHAASKRLSEHGKLDSRQLASLASSLARSMPLDDKDVAANAKHNSTGRDHRAACRQGLQRLAGHIERTARQHKVPVVQPDAFTTQGLAMTAWAYARAYTANGRGGVEQAEEGRGSSAGYGGRRRGQEREQGLQLGIGGAPGGARLLDRSNALMGLKQAAKQAEELLQRGGQSSAAQGAAVQQKGDGKDKGKGSGRGSGSTLSKSTAQAAAVRTEMAPASRPSLHALMDVHGYGKLMSLQQQQQQQQQHSKEVSAEAEGSSTSSSTSPLLSGGSDELTSSSVVSVLDALLQSFSHPQTVSTAEPPHMAMMARAAADIHLELQARLANLQQCMGAARELGWNRAASGSPAAVLHQQLQAELQEHASLLQRLQSSLQSELPAIASAAVRHISPSSSGQEYAAWARGVRRAAELTGGVPQEALAAEQLEAQRQQKLQRDAGQLMHVLRERKAKELQAGAGAGGGDNTLPAVLQQQRKEMKLEKAAWSAASKRSANAVEEAGSEGLVPDAILSIPNRKERERAEKQWLRDRLTAAGQQEVAEDTMDALMLMMQAERKEAAAATAGKAGKGRAGRKAAAAAEESEETSSSGTISSSKLFPSRRQGYSPLDFQQKAALLSPFNLHDAAELSSAFADVGLPQDELFSALADRVLRAELPYNQAHAQLLQSQQEEKRAEGKKAGGRGSSRSSSDGSLRTISKEEASLAEDSVFSEDSLRELSSRDTVKLLHSFLLLAPPQQSQRLLGAACQAFSREQAWAEAGFVPEVVPETALVEQTEAAGSKSLGGSTAGDSKSGKLQLQPFVAQGQDNVTALLLQDTTAEASPSDKAVAAGAGEAGAGLGDGPSGVTPTFDEQPTFEHLLRSQGSSRPRQLPPRHRAAGHTPSSDATFLRNELDGGVVALGGPLAAAQSQRKGPGAVAQDLYSDLSLATAAAAGNAATGAGAGADDVLEEVAASSRARQRVLGAKLVQGTRLSWSGRLLGRAEGGTLLGLLNCLAVAMPPLALVELPVPAATASAKGAASADKLAVPTAGATATAAGATTPFSPAWMKALQRPAAASLLPSGLASAGTVAAAQAAAASAKLSEAFPTAFTGLQPAAIGSALQKERQHRGEAGAAASTGALEEQLSQWMASVSTGLAADSLLPAHWRLPGGLLAPSLHFNKSADEGTGSTAGAGNKKGEDAAAAAAASVTAAPATVDDSAAGKPAPKAEDLDVFQRPAAHKLLDARSEAERVAERQKRAAEAAAARQKAAAAAMEALQAQQLRQKEVVLKRLQRLAVGGLPLYRKVAEELTLDKDSSASLSHSKRQARALHESMLALPQLHSFSSSVARYLGRSRQRDISLEEGMLTAALLATRASSAGDILQQEGLVALSQLMAAEGGGSAGAALQEEGGSALLLNQLQRPAYAGLLHALARQLTDKAELVQAVTAAQQDSSALTLGGKKQQQRVLELKEQQLKKRRGSNGKLDRAVFIDDSEAEEEEREQRKADKAQRDAKKENSSFLQSLPPVLAIGVTGNGAAGAGKSNSKSPYSQRLLSLKGYCYTSIAISCALARSTGVLQPWRKEGSSSSGSSSSSAHLLRLQRKEQAEALSRSLYDDRSLVDAAMLLTAMPLKSLQSPSMPSAAAASSAAIATVGTVSPPASASLSSLDGIYYAWTALAVLPLAMRSSSLQLADTRGHSQSNSRSQHKDRKGGSSPSSPAYLASTSPSPSYSSASSAGASEEQSLVLSRAKQYISHAPAVLQAMVQRLPAAGQGGAAAASNAETSAGAGRRASGGGGGGGGASAPAAISDPSFSDAALLTSLAAEAASAVAGLAAGSAGAGKGKA